MPMTSTPSDPPLVEDNPDIEYLIAAIWSAYDSLADDNDSASAQIVLLEALRKFDRWWPA